METLNRIREILEDDSLYFKALNIASFNPIIELSDPDLKRIQESTDLDKINKKIKQIIPIVLPTDWVDLQSSERKSRPRGIPKP